MKLPKGNLNTFWVLPPGVSLSNLNLNLEEGSFRKIYKFVKMGGGKRKNSGGKSTKKSKKAKKDKPSQPAPSTPIPTALFSAGMTEWVDMNGRVIPLGDPIPAVYGTCLTFHCRVYKKF